MAITFEQAAALHKVGGIIFDRSRHHVVDNNVWLHSVRMRARENGFPCWENLFLYHHTQSDTFVLAVWVNKDPSLGPIAMCELLAMDGPPGHPTYNGKKFETPDISVILERIRPAEYHAKKAKETEDARRDELIMKDFKDAELRHRMVRDLGSQNEALASLITSGILPTSSEEVDSDAFLSSALAKKGKCTNSALVDGTKGLQS